jgi:uncharacterized membrane protein
LRLSEELIIFFTAALPISELRGAIPLGVSFNQPLLKTFLLAVAGNLLPIAPLLLFFEPISRGLRHFKLWRRFFEWLFERTKRKANLVERFEAIGLAIFVAIPLPMTGAWTGCIAATLFKIRFRYAFLAIAVGVIIAGLIVTALSVAGMCLLR